MKIEISFKKNKAVPVHQMRILICKMDMQRNKILWQKHLRLKVCVKRMGVPIKIV